MASTLASIDLLVLILIALSVALIETPVPRAWSLAAVALLVVQSFAIHQIDLQPYEPGAPRSNAVVHTLAEAVGVLVVPALTAALLSVIFFYCARAYARAKPCCPVTRSSSCSGSPATAASRSARTVRRLPA